MKLALGLLIAVTASAPAFGAVTARSKRPQVTREVLVSRPTSDAPAPSAREIAYFKDLLSRAETAPIEDFFHLWYPDQERELKTSYLDFCVNLQRTEMVREANGTLSKACQPDVLYSWGPEIKLKTIRSELTDGANWAKPVNGGRSVWMTISPISTYSYGAIPIRFKFKPQTTFVHEGKDGTVWEHTGGLMDFIFDNGSVLESWSFGMPQHYDEIIKDIRQFAKTTEIVTYSGYRGANPDYRNIYIAGVMEREAQSEETLRQRLTLMIKMILENKGEVHYAKGVSQSVKQHFATDHPTYFNED